MKKRHYSNYFRGVVNFKETKMKLVTSNELDELHDILHNLRDTAGCFNFSNSY
ncbi:MAG: hypothetical protein P8I45_00330 [Nitrospinaceae bacterium]|nr:hypothetical protein [Nitrospinaceae bacterium]